MPNLPGREFRPTLQEIPLDAVADDLLPDSVMGDMAPGETRFTRTGPGVAMPKSITVEDVDLLVTMKWGKHRGAGKREMHTQFLTNLGPAASIDCLEGLIEQIREICAQDTGRNN